MPHYLVQVAYTAEAWKNLVSNPQDRTAAVKGAIEKLGGSMGDFWMTFGEYDLIGILHMPDNVSAAAFAIAVSAGGAVKAIKTTPLLSIGEGVEAMKKAGAAGYRPPGS